MRIFSSIFRLGRSPSSATTPAAHFEPLEGRQLFSAAAGPAIDAGNLDQPIRGEWILGVDPKATQVQGRSVEEQLTKLDRMFSRRGLDLSVARRLGTDGQYLLEVPDAAPTSMLRRAAQRLPGFRYLQPNQVITGSAVPNDPSFGALYGLHNDGTMWFGFAREDADVDAPEAWDLTTGSGNVVVGVIDTGVDYTHPDLAANMWVNPGEIAGDRVDNDNNGYVDDIHGIDPANDDSDPMDDQGHGTHCAGTIGAVGNNGIGVAGVNWNVKIMALKFMNPTPDGRARGSTADAIECINYATMMRQRGVNVVATNNSWGAVGEEEPAQKEAIEAHGRAGILFVAAAGNSTLDNDGEFRSYPASHDSANIISVAATDFTDALADFSNYGRTSVDVAAPGVDILSTIPGGGYTSYSGTSMAAPHVAGLAALAWSFRPTATWQEVRSAILSSVDPIDWLSGKVATGGRVNALGTLRALGGDTPNAITGRVFIDADGDGAADTAEGPLPGATVVLDADDDGTLDVWNQDHVSTNVPVGIPEWWHTSSTLSVSGVVGTVTDVDVTLDISHTYQSDLEVYLVAPSGRRVELFTAVGTSADDFENTTLDDEAATSIADGTGRFTGRFRPEGRLSDFDGFDPNGLWRMEIEDTEMNDAGTLNSWSIRLTLGERTATTSATGAYALTNLAPGPYVVRQLTPAGHTQTAPAGGAHRVTVTAGQAVTGRDFGNFPGAIPAASVVGRHVFYNGSRFDQGDLAADARDDAAVATNKSALLPGGRATFSNITSYSRGINGVMVDVRNLPQGTPLAASDFAFEVGSGHAGSQWSAVPTPAAVSVRRGAGAGGSDRVTLTWADGSVRNTWLRVTVRPSAGTGLTAPDVFYFGNLVGFTGRSSVPIVTPADVTATRRAFLPGGRTAPPTSAFDHNRDGLIDGRDALLARGALTRRLGQLSPAE